MEQRMFTCENGIYSADIDITVDEWKEMLINPEVFDEESKDMIHYWYNQPDYQASNKEIITKYNLPKSNFNFDVMHLGRRIVKYLNRFEVKNEKGGNSFFVIPFEGWYENFKTSGYFIWKLRDELVEAIEELELFDPPSHSINEDYESLDITTKTSDGKVTVRYTTQYERNPRNRRLAIKLHGTKCQICDFDFEKVYGIRGKGFIEVHHIKPLAENQKEVVIDPEKDLICVCSNCHRMFHRRKDEVPTPEELKKSIQISNEK